MVQKITWVFAIVFLAIGVLGFVPGVTTADSMLLGMFHVDSLHSIIHLVTGLVLAFAAWSSASSSQLALKVFGVVYALVMVVGFVQGDTVLGLFAVNMADNVLHLVLAAGLLYAGFIMKEGSSMGAAQPQMQNMGSDMGGQGM